MMADIEVLTENTAQITTGKKYSAGATEPDKDAFLAEMGPHRANHRHIPDPAKTYLTLAAIDFALTRAECAGIHPVPQLPNRLTKRTNINWQRCHNCNFHTVFDTPQCTQDNYSITLQVNNYYARLNIIVEKADLR